MALDRIKYDIVPYLKQLNLIDRLFYIERITAEVNTNGVSLMACIDLGGTVVNFGTQSNLARAPITYIVNRLGPVHHLEMMPIAAVDWFDLEITVRPVELNVRVVPIGRETSIPGRAPGPAASLIFDIHPFCFPADARHIKPVAKRLYIDMEGDMTPQLNFEDGTSQTLAALSHTTRQVADVALLTANRIINVTLLGDFSSADNILYDIGIDIFIPAQRRTAIG